MNKTMLVAVGVAALGGCSVTPFYQDLSAGELGCEARNIKIANKHNDALTDIRTWVAVCNGKQYVCSYHHGDGSRCKEAKDQNMKLEYLED